MSLHQSRTALFDAVKDGNIKKLVNVYAAMGVRTLNFSIPTLSKVSSDDRIDSQKQCCNGNVATPLFGRDDDMYAIETYDCLQRLVAMTDPAHLTTQQENRTEMYLKTSFSSSFNGSSGEYQLQSGSTKQEVSKDILKMMHTHSPSNLHDEVSNLPTFPILSEVSQKKEQIRHNRNFIGRKNSKRRKSLSPIPSIRGSQTIDSMFSDASRRLTNTGPDSSFVAYRHHHIEEANRNDEGSSPIYDGAVANATPMGVVGTIRTRSGGSGTILHLACALDSAFVLAVLLVMGADPSSRHTIFQRLQIHEAAACDSPQCLSLLLELGEKYEQELMDGLCRKDASKHIGSDVGNLSCSVDLVSGRFPKTSMESMTCMHLTSNKSAFVHLLQRILDLSLKIETKQLTELEAAHLLLAQADISMENKVIIAATCHMNRSETMQNMGRAVLCKDLISTSMNATYADGHGNSPLHWASFKNATACVSLLLSHQANPNDVAKSSGWTPLHDASYSDSAESVSLLISAGADVNVRAHSGATPLCFAAQEDSPNAALALLQAGADAGIRCCGQQFQPSHMNSSRFSGYSALHYCAHYNAYKSARVILEHSFQAKQTNRSLLEVPDFNEKLPIHVAVARGSSDVLREFLHSGVRLDTESEKSTTSTSTTSNLNDVQVLDANTTMPAVESPEIDREVDTTDTYDAPSSPVPAVTSVITPVSSPLLQSMIPTTPVSSSKPWNCLSQRSIDECKLLLRSAELNWAPERHSIFHPSDRLAVMELLRVGKRFEQMGTGIFVELWPLVLSYCGRGWFEPDSKADSEAPTLTP